MKLIISNASADPIYEQIASQIKDSIVKGELVPGELLPSIRSLAKDLQISVITTKRAYEELEKEGYVETVGGKGTFVAGQNKELLREKRLKAIEDKLIEVVAESRIMNLGYDDICKMLKLFFEEE